MDQVGGRVRRRRSRPCVAVTGATTPLGHAVLRLLVADEQHPSVVAIASSPVDVEGATWRPSAPGRYVDPDLFEGVDVVIHLDTDRTATTPPAPRRAVNVEGTETLLDSADEAGVRKVVLLTSAMVYGAAPGNSVPLEEDAPLMPSSPGGLVGDWLAMERAALARSARGGGLEVVSVRPASVVGLTADALLPGLFEAVRLLGLRDGRCHWQFCHTDDLVNVLVLAAAGGLTGAVTVGCDGWLERGEVESIAAMRSVLLPSSVAFATAERLHRIGSLSSPASDLHFLMHPWVVDSQQLRAAGWRPAWTNESALADHLRTLGDRAGRSLVVVDRRNATRAAAGAGATLAVIGSLALARSRSRRR